MVLGSLNNDDIVRLQLVHLYIKEEETLSTTKVRSVWIDVTWSRKLILFVSTDNYASCMTDRRLA